VDCSRRWTATLKDAAAVWWNPKEDPLVTDGPPVAFSNFGPICRDYRQPDPDVDHRELEPGEVNP